MFGSLALDGKVAIVTGGAGGIGSETLRLLALRGARVVVADINLPAAQTVADSICAAGGSAFAIEVDLTSERSIAEMTMATVGRFGGLDILNNNAALLRPDIAAKDVDIESMPLDVWDQSYAVNVRGAMIACREALPHLVKRKGCIVNTVSNLALQGHVIQAAYSSSKAALIQMTRSIAASHGRRGVRCNAVAPGMTMTAALKEAFPAHIREMVEAETLRDQLGEPQDIAEVVAWLASDAARNITGQVIVADGGLESHVPGFGPFHAMISGSAGK